MFVDKNLIIDLNNCPERVERAALWFHQKWQVPKQAYFDSMTSALKSENGVPRWYIVLNDQEEIIAGVGVIENDFHQRPDLTPNICALFVEKAYRQQGIAKALLDNACIELAQKGINTSYLTTDLMDFYEQCGWNFYAIIEDDDGNAVRMYHYESASND